MAVFTFSAFADEADGRLSVQLEALKQAGIAQIEMRGVDGINVARLTDEQARTAKRMLDDAGVSISAMGSPYGKYPIDQPFAPHLDDFKRGLELCGILGARRVRMFSFFIPSGADAAVYRGEVLSRLGAMLDLAREAGVQLLHENEKGIYGDTDDRCLDILEAFGGRLLGVFDPANFIQCGVRPDIAMPKLEKHIAYMHIKDAMLSDGSVVPCGMGDGCLSELLSRVAYRADGMTLSLEPHLSAFVGLSDLQDEEVKHTFAYPNTRSAFFAAADALKKTLTEIGFAPLKGCVGTWMK